MVYYGFTVCTGKEDVFVASDRQNITKNAAAEFINRYLCAKKRFVKASDALVQWTKGHMIKATYELVTTANGYKYHKITYANGMCCIPLDDKSAVIIL